MLLVKGVVNLTTPGNFYLPVEPSANLRKVDPLAFVVSKNLKRRHLNESQRAMVAAKIANMPTHRPADKSANLRTSQSDAATLLNTSERSIQHAKKVERDAIPEIVEAVESGGMRFWNHLGYGQKLVVMVLIGTRAKVKLFHLC